MKVEKIDIEKLLFDPQNARKHGDKNIDAIKGSLSKFGQVEPLIVQKSTGIIIGGNGRLEAMKQLGFTEVDIVKVDLDNTQATALGLALNRTAELAEWDKDVLGQLLHGLREDDYDLLSIGFDTSYLDSFNDPVIEVTGSQELDEKDFSEFENQCPKCGFEFNDKT